MLQRYLKYPLLAVAIMAGAAQAQHSAHVTFGDRNPVVNAFGDAWRTAQWDTKSNAVEIMFGFDRAELDPQSRKRLDALALDLLAADSAVIEVTAHADRIGDPDYNQRLSARRGEAVRSYLVKKGVPEALLRVESRGASDPRTGHECDALGSADGRNTRLVACLEQDRRVEITVSGPERFLR